MAIPRSPKKRNTTEITPFVGKNYPHLHPRTDTTRERKYGVRPPPHLRHEGGTVGTLQGWLPRQFFFSPRWALLRALRLPHQSNRPPLLSAVSSLHALSDRHLVRVPGMTCISTRPARMPRRGARCGRRPRVSSAGG
jgi:hypothetical protein